MTTLFSETAGQQAAAVASSLQPESNRRRLQRWPLELLADRVSNARELFTARANSTRYPVRAIRYWWAHCALLDEVRAQGRPITIADVGCSTGHLRRYTGHIDGAAWMGLDWKIEPEVLRERGYASWKECDFDRPLPLPDASVDVVVHLHVIEHLPRPEFSFKELARIVKPGGVILAGSPAMPPLLSRLRERQHRTNLACGRIAVGRHINSMDGPRWVRLARENGLVPEMVQGAFFMRWSGWTMENHAWWLRLNLAWGALFPSLGGEIYLAMRKPMRC